MLQTLHLMFASHDGDDIEAMADEAEEKYHQESMTDKDGFMSIPEGMEDELPFK